MGNKYLEYAIIALYVTFDILLSHGVFFGKLSTLAFLIFCCLAIADIVEIPNIRTILIVIMAFVLLGLAFMNARHILFIYIIGFIAAIAVHVMDYLNDKEQRHHLIFAAISIICLLFCLKANFDPLSLLYIEKYVWILSKISLVSGCFYVGICSKNRYF